MKKELTKTQQEHVDLVTPLQFMQVTSSVNALPAPGACDRRFMVVNADHATDRLEVEVAAWDGRVADTMDHAQLAALVTPQEGGAA